MSSSVEQSYFLRHLNTAMQQQLSLSNILLICNVMIQLASRINISAILSAILLSVHTILNRIFLTHHVLFIDLYLSQFTATLDNRRTSKYRHFDKRIKAFVNVIKTNNSSIWVETRPLHEYPKFGHWKPKYKWNSPLHYSEWFGMAKFPRSPEKIFLAGL